MTRRAIVRTIGHGTRSRRANAERLVGAGVATVFDVRRYPAGRRQPHLSRERLAEDLPALGVTYEWWGDALGGRRSADAEGRAKSGWRNPAFAAYEAYMSGAAFREALSRLETRVASNERLALMCAETLWWRCHRRLIADALVRDGVEVEHLVERAPPRPHSSGPA